MALLKHPKPDGCHDIREWMDVTIRIPERMMLAAGHPLFGSTLRIHDAPVAPEAGSNALALARYPSRAPDALVLAGRIAVHAGIAVGACRLRLHHARWRDGSNDGHGRIGG